MALFRVKITEASIKTMEIEANNAREAEDYFTITRYYNILKNPEGPPVVTSKQLSTTEIYKEIVPITNEEAQGFVHAPYEVVKKELDWLREQLLTKQRIMKQQYNQIIERRITSMDMIQHEDVYVCLFSLLMKRQAEEYENGSLDRASRQLAAELTKMEQTCRSFEVAVLFELTIWLREHRFHWYCSPEMKNSILLYLLGITKNKPRLQRPSIWTSNEPVFEIVVQEEAFDKLEEQFNSHWFTLVCNQHYEINRKHGNTAKYGCIIFTKEGEGTDVRRSNQKF